MDISTNQCNQFHRWVWVLCDQSQVASATTSQPQHLVPSAVTSPRFWVVKHNYHASVLSAILSCCDECHLPKAATKMKKIQQAATTQHANSPTTHDQHYNHYQDACKYQSHTLRSIAFPSQAHPHSRTSRSAGRRRLWQLDFGSSNDVCALRYMYRRRTISE